MTTIIPKTKAQLCLMSPFRRMSYHVYYWLCCYKEDLGCLVQIWTTVAMMFFPIVIWIGLQYGWYLMPLIWLGPLVLWIGGSQLLQAYTKPFIETKPSSYHILCGDCSCEWDIKGTLEQWTTCPKCGKKRPTKSKEEEMAGYPYLGPIY